jgi:hypothetical protein
VYILEVTTAQAARYMTVGNYSLTASLVPLRSVAIQPYSLTQGTVVNVQILGTGFYGPPFTVEVTSCQSGSVTVTDVVLIDSLHATAVFHVSSNALGNCNLRVTAANGTAYHSFTVLPPPPVILSISPGEASRGESVSVTINGSNFKPQMTIDASPINVSNLVIANSTLATALFSIPSNLSGTTVRIKLNNNDGAVSNEYSFVIKPAVPILTVNL